MARQKCVPCISRDIKDVIRQYSADPVLNDRLGKVADCPHDTEIEICGGKGSRKASGYQVFIKECLSTKPLKGQPFGTAGKFMKECALEWRKKAGK